MPYESHHKKTGFLPMRKQRRRSAAPIPGYFQNFKLLAFFCDCTGWFISDLVGNHGQVFMCYDSYEVHHENTEYLLRGVEVDLTHNQCFEEFFLKISKTFN